jgi:hypothetical protein
MDKMDILLHFYADFFIEKGIIPKKGGVANEHIAWMINECIGMLSNPGDTEYNSMYMKINRWVGFVQGVLWKEGLFTIDQMREHVALAHAVETGMRQSV